MEQVIIHIVVKENVKNPQELLLCVESIRRSDDSVLYGIPPKVQPEQFHPELFSLPQVHNAVKNLSKKGHFRNLRITLKEPVKNLYMDVDSNFVFQGQYLDESESEVFDAKADHMSAEKDFKTELLDLLRSLKTEDKKTSDTPPEQKLGAVEENFSIEKFNGKQKAKTWLDNFEAECVRHQISDEALKVKCLKLFMTDGALDWYQANAIKIFRDAWAPWAESFVKVFSEKGWSKLRDACGYKFMVGSMVEYALKKERLLLEAESTMSELSRVGLIVLGLPIHVQEKLDRERILGTDDLLNKLGQYDFGTRPRKPSNEGDARNTEKKPPGRKSYSDVERSSEKKPCPICESINYPGRFHAPEKCRNRDRAAGKMKINMAEASDFGEVEFGEQEKN